MSSALQQGGAPRQLDQFGHITPVRHVDRGWLSAESVVQLKLFNNPVQLWKRRQRKVSPVNTERYLNLSHAIGRSPGPL